MLRKIWSFLFLVIFLTNTVSYSYASLSIQNYGSENVNLISLSKDNIKRLKNGSKYLIKLNKLEQFINKQTDLKLLEKINLKLEEKKELVSGQDQLTYELLYCIGLIVEKRIDDLLTLKSADVIKQIDKSTLTKEEIKKVEDEIVKLQINLLDSSRIFIDKLLSDLKKSLNAEETGNLKLNVEGSGSMIGNGKGELSIKDYKSRAANFDSQFEAQVDMLVEASLVSGQEFKAQFSSFINFISKDGNMYLLLEKLSYSGLDNIDYSGEYTSILDKIKSMGENNQYVKFEDKQSEMVLNMIKNFDLNSFYNEANKALEKSMFKPYKKEGNKYYLLPTKKACDTIKYIDYKFNGHGRYTCSDEDYNNLLKKAVINGNMYIIIDGTDKHFGLESAKYGLNSFIKIYYSDKKIEKVSVKSEIIAGKDKGDLFQLTYINGQKLDFVLNIVDNKANFSFKSMLTSDNKFSKIDYVGNVLIEGFSSSFKLDNKKFNGNLEIKDNSGKLVGKLSGELNTLNDLSSFDFVVNASDENRFSFDLDYSLNNEIIEGTAVYKEKGKELFSIKSNGKYKKEYFELNNKINIVNYYNDQEISANLNTKFIGNLEDNTFDMYIDLYSNLGYLKINLNTDSKVQYKDDIKIEEPSNYKTFDSIILENIKRQDSKEIGDPEFFY